MADDTAPVRKPRLLIIEDEEGIRHFMQRALEPAYEVHLASQGQEGVNQARWVKPDLILLDIRMPGFDGLTVLAKLKASALTRAIPVVIVSGRGDSEMMMACQQAGAVDHVIKPFNVTDLRDVIERQLVLRGDEPETSGTEPTEP
jgi:DNA-binding response OmpR family regulator